MGDVFDALRAAVADYDDWPTPQKHAQMADAARRFVHAIDQRAAVIEHMRQCVTPSQQALSELLNQSPFADENNPRDKDGQGVDFGPNCLTLGTCRELNTCLGTCKLF